MRVWDGGKKAAKALNAHGTARAVVRGKLNAVVQAWNRLLQALLKPQKIGQIMAQLLEMALFFCRISFNWARGEH